MPQFTIKRALPAPLCCGGGVTANLVHYGAGLQQSHHHEEDQLSFLLIGEVQERARARDEEHVSPSISFKPAGLRHSNRWADTGALIFSLQMSEAAVARNLDVGWSRLRQPSLVRALATACLFAAGQDERASIVSDIIALSMSPLHHRGTPPGWLEAIRIEIRDSDGQVSVAEIAKRTGVHRVYLSRAFSAYFGVPPTMYRLRSLAARTVSAAVSNRDFLTRITHDAGFYDQSHACRVVKSLTGLTLGQIRRLTRSVAAN